MGNMKKANQQGKVETNKVDQKAPGVGKVSNNGSNSLSRNGNLRFNNEE